MKVVYGGGRRHRRRRRSDDIRFRPSHKHKSGLLKLGLWKAQQRPPQQNSTSLSTLLRIFLIWILGLWGRSSAHPLFHEEVMCELACIERGASSCDRACYRQLGSFYECCVLQLPSNRQLDVCDLKCLAKGLRCNASCHEIYKSDFCCIGSLFGKNSFSECDERCRIMGKGRCSSLCYEVHGKSAECCTNDVHFQLWKADGWGHQPHDVVCDQYCLQRFRSYACCIHPSHLGNKGFLVQAMGHSQSSEISCEGSWIGGDKFPLESKASIQVHCKYMSTAIDLVNYLPLNVSILGALYDWRDVSNSQILVTVNPAMKCIFVDFVPRLRGNFLLKIFDINDYINLQFPFSVYGETKVSKNISKLCTTTSLQNMNVAMYEGSLLTFNVIAYNRKCEMAPCIGNLQCNIDCPACEYYSGHPYFYVDLVDSASSTVPYVFCSVMGHMTNGAYPAGCLALNSLAGTSNYNLRLLITEDASKAELSPLIMTNISLHAGSVSPSSSIGSWIKSNFIKLGNKAALRVKMRDAYNNILTMQSNKGEIANISTNILQLPEYMNLAKPEIDVVANDEDLIVYFRPQAAGTFMLDIGFANERILNSPFPLTVSEAAGDPGISEYCSLFDTISAKIYAIYEGIPINFTLTAFSIKCQQTPCLSVSPGCVLEGGCPTCSVLCGGCIPYTGLPHFEIYMVDSQQSPVPNFLCTVGLHILNGTYPVTCTAKNSYADAEKIFSIRARITDTPNYPREAPYMVMETRLLAGNLSVPNSDAVWETSSTTFQAGDNCSLEVILRDNYRNIYSNATGRNDVINVNITVTDKKTGKIVPVTFSVLTSPRRLINFSAPTTVGDYDLTVLINKQKLPGSPFLFTVIAGPIFENKCILKFVMGKSVFASGDRAVAQIFLRDAYNNVINASDDEPYIFESTVYAVPKRGIPDPNFTTYSVPDTDYELLYFSPKLVGVFYLHVGTGKNRVTNSPLTFNVSSGPNRTISTDCTSHTLTGVRVVFNEGVNYKFNIVAYGRGCEQEPCLGNLQCSRLCSACKYYDGPPFFTFLLVDSQDRVVPNFTCVSDFTTGNGIYPTFCSAKNSLADAIKVYNLKMYISEVPTMPTINISTSAKVSLYAGDISVAKSIAWWKDPAALFAPKSTALLQVQFKDAYNNYYSSSTGRILPAIATTLTDTLGNKVDVSTTVTYGNGVYTLALPVPEIVDFYLFDVLVYGTSLKGSPFKFSVISDDISISGCIGMWKKSPPIFQAGSNVSLYIELVDKTGIKVTGDHLFRFEIILLNLPHANLNVEYLSSSDYKYEVVQFIPKLAGTFYLSVGYLKEKIRGSPFPFTVSAGPLFVPNCIAAWLNNINIFESGDPVEIRVLLKDQQNNILNAQNGGADAVRFKVTILTNGTNKVAEPAVQFLMDHSTGWQSIYFVPVTIGDFFLMITFQDKTIFNQTLPFKVLPASVSVSSCTANWQGFNRFKAGDPAKVVIHQVNKFGGSMNNETWAPFNFTVSVDGNVGNSKYIYELSLVSVTGNDSQTLSFYTMAAGTHFLEIGDGFNVISNSSLQFNVTAGDVYVPFCRAEWLDDRSIFIAGQEAVLRVLLVDQFNNNISMQTGVAKPTYPFQYNVFVGTTQTKMNTAITNVKVAPDIESGYMRITFRTKIAGEFGLAVGDGKSGVVNSPVPFEVVAGNLSYPNCSGEWPYGNDVFQSGLALEIAVVMRDVYGNPTAKDTRLDVQVYGNGTNVTVPISDLTKVTTDLQSTGRVLYDYTAPEQGKYFMKVGGFMGSLMGSPFNYTTYTGFVDPTRYLCYGDGFLTAIAGVNSTFYVQMYTVDNDYPFEYLPPQYVPIQATLMLGSIIEKASVQKNFTVTVVANDTLTDGTLGLYKVTYKAKSAGIYKLSAIWTNYRICGADASIQVSPGPVNLSQTIIQGDGIGKFASVNVTKYVFVVLRDSFGNVVTGEDANLSLNISGNGTFTTQSTNGLFSTELFTDVVSGYLGTYMVYSTGNFTLTAYYRGQVLKNGSFAIMVVPEDYLPAPRDDSIITWEGIPVIIDVLENDKTQTGNKTLLAISQDPIGGAAVIFQQLNSVYKLIKYTPRTGYIGLDYFVYTMVDAKNMSAEGVVVVEVRIEPPQITAWPTNLTAIEGHPMPMQGGFGGFYASYSDSSAVLFLTARAFHGEVYFPADATHLWHSMDNQSSNGTILSIEGNLHYLNFALQNLRYTGRPYFNGNDTLYLSILDNNTQGDQLYVNIAVEPVNDPPYVIAPSYMFKTSSGQLVAITKKTILGNPLFPPCCISVGDPDSNDVRGDKRVLELELMLQVTHGLITVQLPIDYATVTEYVSDGGLNWEPILQVYYIEDTFAVTGHGIRFRAPVEVCNNALSSLLYSGTVDGAALAVVVNDMGNFGVYQEAHEFPIPLTAEANIIIFVQYPRSMTYLQYLWMAFGEIVTSTLLAALLIFTIIYCLVKMAKKKRHRFVIYNAEDLKIDQECEKSRVYNPLWIPTTVADKKTNVYANKLMVEQRRKEIKEQLQEVDRALESYKSTFDLASTEDANGSNGLTQRRSSSLHKSDYG